MDEPYDSYDEVVRAGLQNSLVDFVRIDLDLAFTFLSGASITTSVQHRESALQKAKVALESIRHYILKIKDIQIADAHTLRADELEAAIVAFTI